jgi:hypothetical protein
LEPCVSLNYPHSSHGTTADVIESFTNHGYHYLALQTLKLTASAAWDRPDIESAQIREFIHLFPNLRVLAIYGADPNFLRELCDAQTIEDLLWPRLSMIVIKSMLEGKDGFTLDDVIRLVENRATLGHPISRITILSSNARWARPQQL